MSTCMMSPFATSLLLKIASKFEFDTRNLYLNPEHVFFLNQG